MASEQPRSALEPEEPPRFWRNMGCLALAVSVIWLLMWSCAALLGDEPTPNTAPTPPAAVSHVSDTLKVSAIGDTLLGSPWVQQGVFDQWKDGPPRFWCITSYAEWPNFLFVRHMEETDIERRCAGDTPVFLYAATCPELVPNTVARFVIVECGYRVFTKYYKGARPAARGSPEEQMS